MLVRIAALIISLAMALTGCQSTTGTQTMAFPQGTLVDMSYAFNADTVYWPTAAGFKKTTDFEGMTQAGYYYSAYSVSTVEHGGTHIDALSTG